MLFLWFDIVSLLGFYICREGEIPVRPLTIRTRIMKTIRVGNRKTDPTGAALFGNIIRLQLGSFQSVWTVRVYRFEGITENEAEKLGRVLADADQDWNVNAPLKTDAKAVVEVGYKPGVMNPEAASLVKIAHDCGINLVAADSSTEYHFYGDFALGDVSAVLSQILVNKTVQMVITHEPQTLLIDGKSPPVEIIPIQVMSDEELVKLSSARELHLNLEEMQVIRAHYLRLGRDAFDCELETLAQTWSEHCSHKTWKARLVVNGQEKAPLIKRLMRKASEYMQNVLSAFVDNSGVARFYDGDAICGKVETHNSPSAIEPYGGAMTGSGGVFRDILGTGKVAKVLLSTDMFCFAPPDLPAGELPPGCLNPDYLLRRVVDGVRDYGNRMGVPTANGSVHFHSDFRAKPTVIVGAYGIMPESAAKKGSPEKGDLIVAIGGRTGRDGIHGATFSSGEMTDKTVSVNASAVQIGHAIEEKRVSDALLKIRDAELIRAVTDCGAGGFSSAIGEMGKEIGVRVWLEKALLKYHGLAPWEIWVSESQERMVLAVSPKDLAMVLEICQDYNVEAAVLGEFTGDGRILVTYDGDVVCDLSMDFLHDGLPQRVMTANWQKVVYGVPTLSEEEFLSYVRAIMSHLNVCSKERIVRQYDHGVQGTSALPPFTGVHSDGPNDAVILKPLLDKPYGMVVSHGMNPMLNRIDPYHGAIWAAVEALSNYVAVGGNFRDSWLVDNFIWPFPDEESLGALDLAVEALCDVMDAFGIPFISGKDSMSGTYRKGELVIKIPPVLCVSVFGKIPDVRKTASADFKKVGSSIFLVGKLDHGAFGGSVLYDTLGFVGNRLPKPDLSNLPLIFDAIHDLIVKGEALAVHDISEGGVFTALAEMCFGGDVGARIDADVIGGVLETLNETPGCFLVEVDAYNQKIMNGLAGLACFIGVTTKDKTVRVESKGKTFLRQNVGDLKHVWQAPLQQIFA